MIFVLSLALVFVSAHWVWRTLQYRYEREESLRLQSQVKELVRARVAWQREERAPYDIAAANALRGRKFDGRPPGPMLADDSEEDYDDFVSRIENIFRYGGSFPHISAFLARASRPATVFFCKACDVGQIVEPSGMDNGSGEHSHICRFCGGEMEAI